MLQNSPVTPIIPVVDLERARKFYGGVLGLKDEGAMVDGNVMFTAGKGTHIELMKKPTGIKADTTTMSFEVDDVERMVKQLSDKGARFEDYDLPGLQTRNKVAMVGQDKAAWFKDSEGNILCLHQRNHRKS